VTCYKTGADMDAIWQSCDERFAIIQGLTAFVAEKANIKTEAPSAPVVESKPKPEAKKEEPEAKSDDKNKDGTSSDDKGDDDGDFNPMSFFSAGG
jgi:hypothetical protein